MPLQNAARAPQFQAWIDKAKETDIDRIVRTRNIKLVGRPPELAGPCPQCGGTDRFSVHLGKQVFNCRGCGAKGRGAIDLVMFLDGCTFFAAVETTTGEPPPDDTGTARRPDPELAQRCARQAGEHAKEQKKRERAAFDETTRKADKASWLCLLIGSMSEEATWMPVRPFVRWLSAQRIAQVWLHHANDLGKSFGDKTREWEMEAVVKLSKVEGDETAILFEFVKARLRTPKTVAQFLPIVIHPGHWEFEGAAKSAGKRNEAEAVADAFLKALDRLADGITKAPGFDGKLVSKVKVDGIRDELKKRGFLEKNETGGLTDTGRSHFRRAKTLLLSTGKILENEDLIWRK
jgi:CHC2 zinc finger